MLLASPDGSRAVELVPLWSHAGSVTLPVRRRGLRSILLRVRLDVSSSPVEAAITVDSAAWKSFVDRMKAMVAGTADRTDLISECRRYAIHVRAGYDSGPVWVSVYFEGVRCEFEAEPSALMVAVAFLQNE